MVKLLERRDDQELVDIKAELLSTIGQLESIVFYQTVADKMAKNTTILTYIKQKKRIQKELVNAKRVQKEGQIALLERELLNVEERLFNVPLYQQYLSALEEAQETLDIVSACIQDALAVQTNFTEEDEDENKLY